MYDDSSYGTAEGDMNTYSAICIIITAVKKDTYNKNELSREKYCVHFCVC